MDLAVSARIPQTLNWPRTEAAHMRCPLYIRNSNLWRMHLSTTHIPASQHFDHPVPLVQSCQSCVLPAMRRESEQALRHRPNGIGYSKLAAILAAAWSVSQLLITDLTRYGNSLLRRHQVALAELLLASRLLRASCSPQQRKRRSISSAIRRLPSNASVPSVAAGGRHSPPLARQRINVRMAPRSGHPAQWSLWSKVVNRTASPRAHHQCGQSHSAHQAASASSSHRWRGPSYPEPHPATGHRAHHQVRTRGDHQGRRELIGTIGLTTMASMPGCRIGSSRRHRKPGSGRRGN